MMTYIIYRQFAVKTLIRRKRGMMPGHHSPMEENEKVLFSNNNVLAGKKVSIRGHKKGNAAYLLNIPRYMRQEGFASYKRNMKKLSITLINAWRIKGF